LRTAGDGSQENHRGLSLERKLPLLVATLLAVVVAATLAITYREMTRSARFVAVENLRRVTRELAASVEASTRQRGAQLQHLGTDTLVRRVLNGAASDADQVRTALLRQLPGADSALPFRFWSADGRAIPIALDLSSSTAFERSAVIPPRADSTRYGPLYATSGRVFFWVVSPVVSGAQRLGWIAEQRRITTTPDEDRRIKGILGPETGVYFHNADGSLWTTVSGSPVPPPIYEHRSDSLTNRLRPRNGSKERVLGAESPIRGTPWNIALELPDRVAILGPRTAVLRLAAFALVLLVVAGLATWAISRRLTRPLVELTHAAETMSRGDFASGVSESYAARGDEIGRLAASFNRMVADLSTARANLEQQLEEAQSLTEELEQTAEEAQQAADQTQASEERFRSLVEATTQVVWTTYADGTVDDVPSWRALTGQAPDEVKGFGWLDAVHNDDRPRILELWRRAVEARTPVRTECRIRMAGGSHRWFGVRAVPVLESSGAVREWVGTCTDIDDRVRQERAARFLADASAALAQTLDIDATLAMIAEFAIADLADGSLVTLTEAQTPGHVVPGLKPVAFRQVAVASRDPTKAALVREIDQRFPLPPDAPSGYPHVISTGLSEIVDPRAFDERVLPGIAQSPEHLALLGRLEMYSGMVVPLIARGRILGALTLVRHGPERRPLFDARDLALAEELGRRAALAVDNGRSVREAHDARRFAELANQSKSDFLATMSHEIRTPINAIIGYTQLMEMGIAGPVTEDQQTQLERVTASGKHLLGLIDDILDFSKIEAGRLRVASAPAIAGAAVDASLALIRPQAAAKGVKMSAECEGMPDVQYSGDEQRVQQILVNVFSNAVKFTPPGGRVRVLCGISDHLPAEAEVRSSAPWVYFAVEDTGIGIAPELAQRIFQPFVQADAGYKRTQSGTGLGLAISRRLARLMGGDLTVESHQGEGSRFSLWLSAAAADSATMVGDPRMALRQDLVIAAPLSSRRPATESILTTIGRVLLEDVNSIVDRFTEVLREDPEMFANVERLTTVQLQNHVVAWVADLAQALITLESVAGDPSELMRDGSEIQRVICERHGAQRHRIGWEERALAHEFQLLHGIIEKTLASRGLLAHPASQAGSIIAGFIQRADQISRRGYRQAAQMESAAVG
jgi:PAS domain S-box-containing protein